MKSETTTVDYRGENLGIRIGPERCQAIVRDYDKKSWSIYGAPDSYPRSQKHWIQKDSGFGILRLAVQVLRNEIGSDLLEVLTGDKTFADAKGYQPTAAARKQTA
jgi:hypothetical protein